MMEESLVPNPTKIRCYRCGSPNVYAICHHCGRAMCKRHAGDTIPQRLGIWQALAIHLGLRESPDADLADFDIQVKQIGLWHELGSSLRLIKIDNPENDFELEEVPDEVTGRAGFIRKARYWLRHELAPIVGVQLGKSIGSSHHCKSCTHYVIYFPYGVALLTLILAPVLGLLTVVLTRNIIFGAPLPGFLQWLEQYDDLLILLWLAVTPLTLISVYLLALIFIYNGTENLSSQAKQLTHIHVPGYVGKVLVRETCSGEITQDDQGHYTTTRAKLSGKLVVPLTFNKYDCQHYYNVFLDKAEDLGVLDAPRRMLQVGFLRLGGHCWEITHGKPGINETGTAFPLRYSADENPLKDILDNPSLPETKSDVFNWAYHVPEKCRIPNRPNLPVQVILRLLPNRDRRMVELEFDLTEPDAKGAAGATIEQLDLWIPNDMGAIEGHKPEGRLDPLPGADSDGPGKDWQRITWKKLAFEAGRETFGKNYRCALYIQFRNPIDPNRITSPAHLRGILVLRFPAAASGLDQVDIFYPCGTRREKPELDIETLYRIKLDLDLSYLRYQTLKHLEDEVPPKDGVVPDTAAVTAITNSLSSEGYYIKRITENPSRLSKEGERKVNRYWDISGRKYEGIYPIEFHLVLIGEEEEVLNQSYSNGKIHALISVQAPVTNAAMESKVEAVLEQLKALIEQAIS